MTSIFSHIDRRGTTLLYLSACLYHDDFQNLPYDNVILGSDTFKKAEKIGKVFCVKSDNNALLAALFRCQIFVDAIVIINDGCNEGGNYECCTQSNALGRMMPVIKDGTLFWVDHCDGFRSRWRTNIPFEIKTLSSVPDYVQILLNRSFPRGPAKGFVFIKKPAPPRSMILGRIKLTLHRESIWNHYQTFDGLYFTSMSTGRRGVKHYIKALDFQHCRIIESYPLNSILDCLHEADEKRQSRIAFNPFGRHEYATALEEIAAWTQDYPSEITFFHLHKNDFRSIYVKMSGDA